MLQAKWMNKLVSMGIAWIGIYRIATLKKLGVKRSRKFGEIHFYCVDKCLSKTAVPHVKKPKIDDAGQLDMS